jgi:hypothetical protein
MTTALRPNEAEFLQKAAEYLENPSYLTKIAECVGKPVEWVLTKVDKVSPISTTEIIDCMLKGIMKGAVANLPKEILDLDFQDAYEKSIRDGRWHTTTTAFTGGLGGLFGLAALAVELPISTGVMFRSIASTARNFGRDLTDPETFLDCVSVFSYGGGPSTDDAMDSTYLTMRMTMATEMRVAAQFLAKNTGETFAQQIAKGNCPAVIAFLSRVAARFNLTLTPKMAAFLVPGISVGTGALVNSAFAQHFNRVAEYHFGMERLAANYGDDLVWEEYRTAAIKGRRGTVASPSTTRRIGPPAP